MNWLSKFVAHHPYFVLISITTLSSVCLIVPLTTVNLPNFADPQMGFETRGTVISHRLTAWSNLMESINRPTSPLTTSPLASTPLQPSPHSIPKVDIKSEFNIPAAGLNSTFNDLISGNKMIDEDYNLSAVVERRNESWQGDGGEEEEGWGPNWTDLMRQAEHDDLPDLPDHHHHHHHHHHHLSSDKFFCSEPMGGYGRVVLSSVDGGDLFTRGALLSSCLVEAALLSSPLMSDICETVSAGRCCRPWSLPNYIAMLYNRTSCLNITTSDVSRTKKLITNCHKFFFNNESMPEYNTKDISNRCKRHNAVFNLLHYILDYEFKNGSTPLKNLLIMLPIAQSSASLPYYHSLDIPALRIDNVAVTGVDFGVKSALFDECLLGDTYLVGLGAVSVFLCIWFYTRSVFLTVMTLVAILFSLGIAYFLYVLVFGLRFFPFMNLLVAVVAIGVGGDASLMVCKVWWTCREEQPHASTSKLVHLTHARCARSLLVSSLTTAAAFYSTYVSDITAICCFSVFAGSAVMANMLVMVAWVPACLATCERLWGPCRAPSLPHLSVVPSLLRLRHLLLLLSLLLPALSLSVIFYQPRLRLPDTTHLQLFKASHPFEQYDSHYRKRFWFERLQRGEESGGSSLPLRFVWGVVPRDTGDFLDPSSRGHLTLDQTFDPAHPKSQRWLLSFCNKIRGQAWYQPTPGPLVPNCFLEGFVSWMERKCVDPVDLLSRSPCCESATFPYSRNVFSLCLARAAASLYSTHLLSPYTTPAGPKFAKTNSSVPRLQALVIEYDSNLTFTTSFVTMDNFYQQVEAWLRTELQSAPPGLKNGWFLSEFSLYDVQASLLKDTLFALLLAGGLSFAFVTVATSDLLLGLYAVWVIVCAITSTIAILVLIGWKLNVLESVAICVAIGLSVDFTIHYVIHYKYWRGSEKVAGVGPAARLAESVSLMVGPTFVSCLTSCLAGILMLPSQVLAYTQIGMFLVVVSPVSWVYSTFVLGALLAVAPPPCRAPHPSNTPVELRVRHTGHPADQSPSAASATTIIHDDEILHLDPLPPSDHPLCAK